MKREIKFKTMDMFGHWVYRNLFQYNSEEINAGYFLMTKENLKRRIEEDIVCQFTGLIDSKGHEIYEYDILYLPKSEYNDDTYYDIIFDGGCFIARNSDKKEKFRNEYIPWLLRKGVYVVGNKFDIDPL